MLTEVQLLYASGFLFMGATEEQMQLIAGSGMDAVAYILILYSLAFLMFLLVNMLIYLYDRSATGQSVATKANGRPRTNNHNRTESRQLRDAEEFELDGLMSDDDEEEQASRRKPPKEVRDNDEPLLPSPSTVGRNSDRVAS